jgi:hypothetical protein
MPKEATSSLGARVKAETVILLEEDGERVDITFRVKPSFDVGCRMSDVGIESDSE